MGFTEDTTISKIKGHIRDRGGVFKSWLVGTTKRACRQLGLHGVKRKGDAWIYVRTQSPEIAKKVQSHFVRSFGVEGRNAQGGDFVYAYKKTARTSP